MKSITIKGQKRESVGKKSTMALRNAESVPCVIYGGKEPIHFSTLEKSFKELVYTPDAHTVKIQLEDGTAVNAILQDIQFHPVTDRILHADFYEFTDDKPITMEIPVRLEGRSKGVLNGGVLRFNMRKLTIKALAANLPDEVVIDITPLKIGNKLYVESLRTDAYTILQSDNAVVVAVRRSRVSVDDTDEEDEEGTVEGGDAPAAEGGDAPAES